MAVPEGDSLVPIARAVLHALVWITLYIVPFGLLMVVEVSFIRYQSEFITLLHLAYLTLELAALTWFWRQTEMVAKNPTSPYAQALCNIAVALTFVLYVFGRVPAPEATTVGKRGTSEDFRLRVERRPTLALENETNNFMSKQ